MAISLANLEVYNSQDRGDELSHSSKIMADFSKTPNDVINYNNMVNGMGVLAQNRSLTEALVQSFGGKEYAKNAIMDQNMTEVAKKFASIHADSAKGIAEQAVAHTLGLGNREPTQEFADRFTMGR